MSTHNIPFSIWKKKITLNFPNLQPRDYFLGTQARVRNSPGKRAISVRAIEVRLYVPSLVSLIVLSHSPIVTQKSPDSTVELQWLEHWWLIYYGYRKNSKIWDTSNNCHNRPKNRKVWCNIALMHPKDADGMANSVDPDQTASSEAVWSWSALFAETYLSQYIEFVRYFEHVFESLGKKISQLQTLLFLG